MRPPLLFDNVLLIWISMIVVQLTTSVHTYRQRSQHSRRRSIRLGKYSTDCQSNVRVVCDIFAVKLIVRLFCWTK